MASLEMRSSRSMVREQKLPEFQPSLDLLREKDRDEWTHWVEAKQPLLLGIVYHMVHDPDFTEDFVQDTWERVYRRITSQSTVDDSNLNGYLVSIARNVARDYFKSGDFRFVDRSKNRTDELFEKRADPKDVEGMVLDHELSEELSGLLNTLPKGMKEQLLYFASGYTPKEIAAACNLSPDVVKARRFRAIRTLRRMYAQEQQHSARSIESTGD
jgi:RNA polymerase sigma factor (sigma-70 family)